MTARPAFSPGPEPMKITDEVFEAVGVPFVFLTTVYLLAAQVDELKIDADDLDGLAQWDPEHRARYVEQVTEGLISISQWVDATTKALAEAVTP